jgi:carbonic anhydrase
LFITCADSRIDPWLITQSKPGEIFVIRNAGNIAPILDDDETSADGTAASIDYAVAVLGVAHIVVCGHSSCGAMKGLADPDSLETLPSVARWLEHSHALRAGGVDDLGELIERNVTLQLEHLASYPTVEASDGIQLHGWVYDIGSGAIKVLSPS